MTSVTCVKDPLDRARGRGRPDQSGVSTGSAGCTANARSRKGRRDRGPVSQSVKDLVAGSGLTFEGAGKHELKGVPDSWRLYRVVG